MKAILFTLFFLTLIAFKPKETNSIQLERYYKVSATFSGEFNNNKSFHLIIATNKKNKQEEILPFSYQNDNFIKLDPIVFSEQPSIVSYHSNQDYITLITSIKNKKHTKIVIVDINAITGKHIMSEPIDANFFKATIRNATNNMLLFSNKKDELIIKTIKSANINSNKSKTIQITKETKAVLNKLEDENIDVVSTDEYVTNGSINDIKAYYFNNKLHLTRDDLKSKKTDLLIVSDNGTIKTKSYHFKSVKKAKKLSTYVFEDKLFRFILNKNDALLDAVNLNNDSIKAISLDDNNIKIKSNGFKSLSEFLKQSLKSTNQPTVIVSNTEDSKLILRADYVDKTKYRYHYNWWWHHHWHMQQMMWQQHMMMNQIRQNIPTGFGPNFYYENFYSIRKKEHYFEMILNNDLTIPNTIISKSGVLKVDKKKHIKELEKNKKILHSSTVFIGNIFRYFAYDKVSKKYLIVDKIIND